MVIGSVSFVLRLCFGGLWWLGLLFFWCVLFVCFVVCLWFGFDWLIAFVYGVCLLGYCLTYRLSVCFALWICWVAGFVFVCVLGLDLFGGGWWCLLWNLIISCFEFWFVLVLVGGLTWWFIYSSLTLML